MFLNLFDFGSVKMSILHFDLYWLYDFDGSYPEALLYTKTLVVKSYKI